MKISYKRLKIAVKSSAPCVAKMRKLVSFQPDIFYYKLLDFAPVLEDEVTNRKTSANQASLSARSVQLLTKYVTPVEVHTYCNVHK